MALSQDDTNQGDMDSLQSMQANFIHPIAQS
jgi:hypothetical protein